MSLSTSSKTQKLKTSVSTNTIIFQIVNKGRGKFTFITTFITFLLFQPDCISLNTEFEENANNVGFCQWFVLQIRIHMWLDDIIIYVFQIRLYCCIAGSMQWVSQYFYIIFYIENEEVLFYTVFFKFLSLSLFLSLALSIDVV